MDHMRFFSRMETPRAIRFVQKYEARGAGAQGGAGVGGERRAGPIARLLTAFTPSRPRPSYFCKKTDNPRGLHT